MGPSEDTLQTQMAFEEGAGRYQLPIDLRRLGEVVARIAGEAASQWGSVKDAPFFRDWFATCTRRTRRG